MKQYLREMRFWLTIAIILAAIGLFALTNIQCSVMRLENNLTPKVREWYLDHSLLMEGNIGWWWLEGDTLIERDYFLKLTPAMQEKYISIFWKIRRVEDEATYNARLDFVKKHLSASENWRVEDMARICIVCGYPDERIQMTAKGQQQICYEPGCWELWRYYWQGYRVTASFLRYIGGWRYEPRGVVEMSEFMRIYNAYKGLWEPIDMDAWDQILKESKQGGQK